MAEDKDTGLTAFERALNLEPLDGETEAERDERERLQRRLAPLDEALAPVRPDADLFARISARIGLDGPLSGFHIARRDEGTWKPLAPGVETRTLWRSALSGRWVFLLRLQPGAVLSTHLHGGDEECLVLEGDMEVNGVAFGPGDFQVALKGSRHPEITSRGGCTCLISMAA